MVSRPYVCDDELLNYLVVRIAFDTDGIDISFLLDFLKPFDGYGLHVSRGYVQREDCMDYYHQGNMMLKVYRMGLSETVEIAHVVDNTLLEQLHWDCNFEGRVWIEGETGDVQHLL